MEEQVWRELVQQQLEVGVVEARSTHVWSVMAAEVGALLHCLWREGEEGTGGDAVLGEMDC